MIFYFYNKKSNKRIVTKITKGCIYNNKSGQALNRAIIAICIWWCNGFSIGVIIGGYS